MLRVAALPASSEPRGGSKPVRPGTNTTRTLVRVCPHLDGISTDHLLTIVTWWGARFLL